MKVITKEMLNSWCKADQSSSYALSYVKDSAESSQSKSEFRNNWALKAKQLSKIIAYSWLDDNDQVEDLRKVFWYPNENGALRKLLTSGADSQEWPFLKKLFPGGEKYLPIFTEEEIKLYDFEVTWNSFSSSIEDITGNLGTQESSPVFKVILPYPPRPPLDGSFGLSKDDVENWVKAPLVNEEKTGNEQILPIYPETPYIPTTCC